MPESEKVLGAEPADLAVVRTDRGDTAPWDVVQADSGDVAPQQFSHGAVFFQLGCRGDHAVHAPLYKGFDHPRAGLLVLAQGAHQHRVPEAPSGALGAQDELRQGEVGEVPGHDADGRAGPLDEAAGDAIGGVAQLPGCRRYPLSSLGGDADLTTV